MGAALKPFFMGVYRNVNAMSKISKSYGDQIWYSWSLSDGDFLVQQLEYDPVAGPISIALPPEEFFAEFKVADGVKYVRPTSPVVETSLNEQAESTKLINKNSDLQDHTLQIINEIGPVEQKNTVEIRSFSDINGGDDAQSPNMPNDVSSAPLNYRTFADAIEEELKETFYKALDSIATNKTGALKKITEITESPGPFIEKHKFMFSVFGVKMRKTKNFLLASKFHEKAFELSPHDENILFNLARVQYDAGKPKNAVFSLNRAMKLNPAFREGKCFLKFLQGR